MKNIKEYHVLLEKYLNNECSKEEIRVIVRLFQDPKLSPYLNLWLKELWYKDKYHLKLKNEHSEELLRSIQKQIKKNDNTFDRTKTWKVIAIIILFLIVGVILFFLR